MTGTGHRRRLVAAGAALLVAAGGFAAGHAVATPRIGQSADAPVSKPVASSPAVVAATLVRQLNDPTLNAADLADLLRRVEAPDATDLLTTFTPGPGFEQATGMTADAAAHRPVIGTVVPVATHVVEADGDRARVAVWAVTLVGTSRLGELVASWSTETLDLRSSGTGWLLQAYASTPGPVPTSTQPPSPVQEALTSFGSRS